MLQTSENIQIQHFQIAYPCFSVLLSVEKALSKPAIGINKMFLLTLFGDSSSDLKEEVHFHCHLNAPQILLTSTRYAWKAGKHWWKH